MEEVVKENLYSKISELIQNARQNVVRTVNQTMVRTYFEIGRMIVEDEQQGKLRAEYGKKVLKELSKQLKIKFGKGFSVQNLENMRKFYLIYSDSEKSQPVIRISEKSILSWTHYLILIRIDSSSERRFYEIESQKNNWSVRDLKRQFNSSLFERLALSRDKDEVVKLVKQGQVIDKSEDILKNPLTLEFLGLDEKVSYSENDLENAIISKMQLFLLELGKGFLFEARQKRFTFDEKHFFVDLVFYNRLLQCYVIIDLKTEELAHQDLGQMQMYVNYYDRYVKLDHEKPTIGILLCKKKSSAIVELTLPQEANIYASEYSLYLPDKKLLQNKLTEWMREFEDFR